MLSTIDNRINVELYESFTWYKWGWIDPKKTRYGKEWKNQGEFNLSRLSKSNAKQTQTNTTIDEIRGDSSIITRWIEDYQVGDRVEINGKNYTIIEVRHNKYPNSNTYWFTRLVLAYNTDITEGVGS